jgi:hypothetical protein
VTVTTWVPPAAGTLQVVGLTVRLAVPAACVTATFWPAMITVALRLLTLDGLAAAVRVTLPVPVPRAGASVNQAAPWLAVHPTPSPAVTVTAREPPAPGALQVVGRTVTPTVPAACVTATLWPAMMTVALRLSTLDGLAAAVNVTLPVPLPLAALHVSQSTRLLAVHAASV